MRIDVWSDIACPWCYVGKRRLEGALAGFSHRDEVQIVWRAFELDPGAPRAVDLSAGSYAARLARKYGVSESQAQGMIDRMTATAKADGLDFRFDRVRPGNTFDAHRLLHLARDRGCQDALKERLLAAYLSEGVAIGDRAALAREAATVGLDADEAAAVLETDAHAEQVRADEAEAARLGISGVPFFVLGGTFAVSGAQPKELLLEALERAWAHTVARDLAEGAACGPAGCD